MAKDLDDFGINKTSADGRNRSCKECHRGYLRTHYQNNKAYYVDKARSRKTTIGVALREIIHAAKSKPCLDCQTSYPYYVMDFDHARGEKLFDIGPSASKGISVETLLAEMSKCEVVCSNCHRERTHRRKNLGL